MCWDESVGSIETWTSYCNSIGDRSELFTALVAAWPIRRALYPGSYLDLSPSVAIPSVTYVDTDRRAAKYFGRRDLVHADWQGHGGTGALPEIEFIAADYTKPLPLPPAHFDLLISLYAGPVWQHCGAHLQPGGLLLANASHGDASLAALDPDLQLVAAVLHRDSRYRLDDGDLDRYLVPKNPRAADPALIRRQGRGIAYTKPAFAYVFRTT